MRSSWILQMNPKSNDKCPFKEERQKNQKRRHPEGGGRDYSQASISQGMSRIAGSHLLTQIVKNLPAVCRLGFNSWVRKIPWRRERLPTPVLLPGKSNAERSLVGYSPWSCKESDTHEWLTLTFHQKPGERSQTQLSNTHFHQKLGERYGRDSPLEPLEGNGSADSFISDF